MSLVRTALVGLATGGRTFTGIAALALTTPAGSQTQPDATLAKQQVQAVLGLLAVGELVGDKLPQAPSRLDFPGIHGRVLFGAACGVVVARRSSAAPESVAGEGSEGAALAPGRAGTPPAQLATYALVGAAAAVAGSFGGAHLRGWASSKLGNDWACAVAEDVAVLGLSYAAVKAPGPAN